MPGIKNLDKLAKRLLKAGQKDELIILYGDADPDGIGSVVILREALMSANCAKIMAYFPDRNQDGYGLNEQAVQQLAALAPALLVLIDFALS